MTVEGYKHFIDAQSMSAFDVNAFLMSQAVTRFETAADRDAALEQVVTEGMVSYNKDTGELQLYDGSAWQTVAIGASGAAGSDGQVQYNNGGSFGGASALYYDDVNSRVGIGTTTPTQKLDVNGSIATTGGTTNSRGILLAHQNNINYSYVGRSEGGVADTGNRLGWDYDNDNFDIKTGGNTRLTIDSSGNVGIGATSPTASLEVVGTSLLDNVYSESSSNWNFSQLRATRNASNTANTKIASFLLDGDTASSTDLYDSVNFVLRTDSAPTTGSTSSALNAGLEITAPDSVRFGTGSSERVRIDSSGNVGINDTTPSYTLDVDGDINATGDLRIGGVAMGATSTTYTPTWTSSGIAPTLGNSILTGRYIKINKLVWVQILFIRGSTATNGTGAYRWSLPSGIPARSGIYNYMTQGLARFYDASTGAVPIGSASFFGGSTTAISAYANNGVVGNANPFTWATNDEIVMTFTYEAA